MVNTDASSAACFVNITRNVLNYRVCEYCGNRLKEDRRGNCLSCGAPIKHPNSEHKPRYVEVTTHEDREPRYNIDIEHKLSEVTEEPLTHIKELIGLS